MNEDILIVEDEALIAYDLELTLKSEGFKVCGIAKDAKETFFFIKKAIPDLALVDINLAGKIDGIELGRILKEDYNIPLVFLTSHSDNATLDRIKKLQPEGYLMKPYSSPVLLTNIHLILNKIHKNKSETESKNNSCVFFIKTNKGLLKIDIENIIYAQADDTFTKIFTKEDKYLISQTLKNVTQKLPSDLFIRVHRSYLVNINHIELIMDDHLITNNNPIPISRQCKSELMRRISLL